MSTYIRPSAKVLAHMDRLVAWRRGEHPAPVTVEWDLSNRCVLGCQDCHFAHTHTRGPWVRRDRRLPMAYDAGGDLADIDVVRRGLAELAAEGVRGVIWSGGGEPTTHPQWVEAVEAAFACGLEQGMYTCGGLLTPSSAARVAVAATWVVVSLDAADATTYAAEKGVSGERFDRACEGAAWLTGHQAVVGISYLLHAGNWHRMEHMVALSRQLGATYTTFRPSIQTAPDAPAVCSTDRSWITEALPSLREWAAQPDVEVDPDRFEAYRDWAGHGYDACQGIRLSTTITPDGRVWICPQRRGLPESCLGTIGTEPFGRLWRRHPSAWQVDHQCRVMCRLHLTNQQMAALDQPVLHEAFV